MGALMNIEKLNEFNFLKEDVDKLGERAIVRIVKKGDLYIQLNFWRIHLIFCELLIALLSLNLSTEEMYQLPMVSHPTQKKTLKVLDQVKSKPA